MTCGEQSLKGPFSLGATEADTHGVERTVAMVVHHLAAATRLMDVAPLIEADRRVQVVYTVPPSSRFADGAHDFLRSTGTLTMPWSQVVETKLDLAVAAGQGLLERLHGPVLTLSHGAGPNSYVSRRNGHGPPAARAVTGLGFQGLATHGRVIPSAILLGHEEHRRLLASQCPDALPAAVVAGDLCFDRMLASRPWRTAYRNALGAAPGQRIVVVGSHYGAGSLLSRYPDLLTRLSIELPSKDFQVVMVLHPNIWVSHGKRQVRAWFTECVRSGVALLPPEEGWRAALVAADELLADRSSLACYGAALGLPVLLAPYAAEDVLPGSQFELLGRIAPRLSAGAPIAPQLDAARQSWSPAGTAILRERLTSAPGEAARVIRRTMYHLLRLSEPVAQPLIEPVPIPQPFALPVR